MYEGIEVKPKAVSVVKDDRAMFKVSEISSSLGIHNNPFLNSNIITLFQKVIPNISYWCQVYFFEGRSNSFCEKGSLVFFS